MIVVWRIAVQLLLQTVPKRPVNNLRHSALQATGGKNKLNKRAHERLNPQLILEIEVTQGHLSCGGVFFLACL